LLKRKCIYENKYAYRPIGMLKFTLPFLLATRLLNCVYHCIGLMHNARRYTPDAFGKGE
jgi:hypothetical protein